MILVVNSRPALNDATFFEMQVILEKLKKLDSEMETFVKSEQIIVMENGNGSPCINLTSVPKETCATLIEHKCDFIILEGMGRAIHTNLHAHFTVGKRLKMTRSNWVKMSKCVCGLTVSL